MAKVYVLTAGEYSDYHIKGVFSTREAADAAMVGSDDPEEGQYIYARIEEYELDELVGWSYGDVWQACIQTETGEMREDVRHEFKFRHPARTDVSTHEGIPGWPDAIYAMSPISADHARKVAVEARQEWLRTRELAGRTGQPGGER